MKIIKTLSVRIKDKHAPALKRMASSVNFVWNYINDLSARSIRERGVFLSEFDLHPYTKGGGKLLGLHSQTLQVVAKEYVTRRKQFKKYKLNWRKSVGVKRSLGWIPFNTGAATWKNGQVYHNGQFFKVWDSYGLADYTFLAGSFSEDARGRWYFNVAVEVKQVRPCGTGKVGIDLGLKTTATCSDTSKLETGRFYRDLLPKLKIAQRSGNKTRSRALHAKIRNRRKDSLHKFTTELVKANQLIVIGNVSSKKLVKTKMALSVLDAGWGQLKTLLEYKCAYAGGVFKVANEAYTSQTCSCCGALPSTRPKGIAGLGIREWTCVCGVMHDRDINAARNILALGHERPAGGIPAL
ncbi:transposase (plasmid) [Pseudomonas sp. FeN3W]|nr:transposase [Pseudomonas sp. FeN3W]